MPVEAQELGILSAFWPPSPVQPITRYLRKMRGVLWRRGRRDTEIDDLVQDAFVRLLEYCKHGAVAREPEAVLVRTVQRLSINFDRDSHRNLYAAEAVDLVAYADASTDPVEVLAGEQRLEEIRQILDTVGSRSRDVFLLHRLNGLSYAQISQHTGLPLSTVEKHIARAITALLEHRRLELEQNMSRNQSDPRKDGICGHQLVGARLRRRGGMDCDPA